MIRTTLEQRVEHLERSLGRTQDALDLVLSILESLSKKQELTAYCLNEIKNR